ncbi:hypothetical protein Vretimale_19295, partial [Volvox reticuliferus]
AADILRDLPWKGRLRQKPRQLLPSAYLETRPRARHSKPDFGIPYKPVPPTYDVEAADFSVSVDSFLLDKVQNVGFATIIDDDLKQLALDAAAAAQQYLQASHDVTDIFEYVVRNIYGEIVTDAANHVVMSPGSKQRLQAPLDVRPPEPLRNLWKRSKYLLRKVLPTKPAMRLRRPVIIGNKPGPRPVGVQTLHVDARPGSDKSFVAIIPMEDDTTLLISLFSNVIVNYWAQQVRRFTATNQSSDDSVVVVEASAKEISPDEGMLQDMEEGEPAQNISEQPGGNSYDGEASSGYNISDYERLDSDYSDADDCGVPTDIADTITNLFSVQRVVRLHMHPGQMVLLDGNTVHAGDAGKPNSWSPRLHVYAQSKKVKNATWPLEAMHESFAEKFGEWSLL